MAVIVSIVLTVLKILLITLLILIGIVLFGTVLILFVPVRYRVRAVKDEKILVEGKVTWLFSALNILFEYNDEEFQMTPKIFGVPLEKIKSFFEKKKSRKKEKQNKKKAAQKAKKQKKAKKEEKPVYNTKQKQTANFAKERLLENKAEIRKELADAKKEDEEKTHELEEKAELIVTEADKESYSEKKDSARKAGIWKKIFQKLKGISGIFGKIKNKLHEIKENVKNIYDALKQGKKKVSDIRNFIFDDNTFGTVCIIKENMLHLWKHIGFTVMESDIVVGTGDPCSTGELLGVLAAFMAISGNVVQVQPDFENPVLEGHIKIKGKARVIVVLKIVLKVILSDEWKEFYKRIKEEL